MEGASFSLSNLSDFSQFLLSFACSSIFAENFKVGKGEGTWNESVHHLQAVNQIKQGQWEEILNYI